MELVCCKKNHQNLDQRHVDPRTISTPERPRNMYLIKTTICNSDASRKEFPTKIPIIIGAVRGTTGTHLMTETTCHLGIPSMHFNVGCVPRRQQQQSQTATNIPDKGESTYNNTNQSRLTEEKGDDDIPEALHRNLTKAIVHIARCVIKDKVYRYP